MRERRKDEMRVSSLPVMIPEAGYFYLTLFRLEFLISVTSRSVPPGNPLSKKSLPIKKRFIVTLEGGCGG